MAQVYEKKGAFAIGNVYYIPAQDKKGWKRVALLHLERVISYLGGLEEQDKRSVKLKKALARQLMRFVLLTGIVECWPVQADQRDFCIACKERLNLPSQSQLLH